jgi:hypothetical protein
MNIPIILVAASLGWQSVTAWDTNTLLPPVQVQAASRPIDVERDGHSAPFLADFDGDGVRDLLVGQFHEGGLRVYRNVGTNREPKFGAYTWFQVEGGPGRVPEG